MGDVTAHRGPDDSGEFEDRALVFGMRRLSIIDLEGGHQPISNEDRTIWVVCNGEIYNFKQLRAGLIGRGHHFRTGSDSEVVVHLYEEYGDNLVDHLDGMYGFALWDSSRQRLLIGRDRLGIKPVYYTNAGGFFAFASEAKSLYALPFVSLSLDPIGLVEYLSLGYAPAPRSIAHGISKLPPASLLVCEGGQYKIERYWHVPIGVDDKLTEQEWCEALLAQLEKSIVSQMVSDVPLGAFLSGGIDSSTVVAMMAQASDQPIKTYSIGFEGSSGGQFYNELPYASEVAKLIHSDHHEIVVRPNVAQLLPRLIWHLDEPMADAAFITTYLVSEFARREVKVILSGVGGDELFGGYRRYLGESYGAVYERLPKWLRRGLLLPVARRLPSDRHSPLLNFSRYARSFILSHELPFEERYRSYVQVFSKRTIAELMEAELPASPDALDSAFAQALGVDRLFRLYQVDAQTQLPDDLLMLTDKMSMATSLECRVPLLDQGLVELSARLPSKFKIRGRHLKYILKKGLIGTLPRNILYRKKRGFGAPMGAWIRQELAPVLRSILSRESVERRGLFKWPMIERTIALHAAQREDYTDHLLALMNLEIWCRLYLDGESHEALADELAAGMKS